MSGYIGVNGVARKIKKVYVGVDGVAREVKSGYTGVGGVAKKWYINELLPKGTLVKMNLDGTNRVYRVLKCNGNVALVMGMWDDFTSKYNKTRTTTTFGSITAQKYGDSTLDTYLNTTWYNTLSSEAKNAIVPENVVQYCYKYYDEPNTPNTPTYTYQYQYNWSNSDYENVDNVGNVVVGNRNVFVLDIKDIFDYIGKVCITSDELMTMFWNSTTKVSRHLWLRSSSAEHSTYARNVSGGYGDLDAYDVVGSYVVRPAFNLDLSKISYTILSADTDPNPPATSSYTVTEKVSGASYGFALNSSGYYESKNKGVDNSAAVCRVNLNLAAKSNITFTCINYAESNYDFGLLGKVDSALGTTNKVDSSVAKSFKGSSQSGTQTYTYSNVAAGEHFIDVKFRKDSSASSNNDSLQFKITIANA